ncbi:hypothetical protein [Haloprofundus salinisoli]|uniref:hypothetical protein n=1 Tax=Haloprofundus salinisoli TaxID=2876193 RepID=UPI001CC96FE3|nr:hypothetical protein [Haloprofundus salinisoli]
MNRDIRRRLDVLIWLCASLLGIVFTYLLLSSQTGVGFLFLSLPPTIVIAILAFGYVNRASPAKNREQTNYGREE